MPCLHLQGQAAQEEQCGTYCKIKTVLHKVDRGMETLLTDSYALQERNKGRNFDEFLCMYLFNDVINSYG
jgi:hypothetical protein